MYYNKDGKWESNSMINSLLLWHSFGQTEIPDKVFKINVCFIDTVIILIDLYICHYSITN